ncbi:hypothetical protein C8R43DRAFT_132410 [Mycena crocata]|nr:hypothetical protein C8R43DRAFT_132410 [Mycena crocata]
MHPRGPQLPSIRTLHPDLPPPPPQSASMQPPPQQHRQQTQQSPQPPQGFPPASFGPGPYPPPYPPYPPPGAFPGPPGSTTFHGQLSAFPGSPPFQAAAGPSTFPGEATTSTAPPASSYAGSDAEADRDRDTEGGPPKKKRRRQALSCTECKRRKIRCDRTQPCSPCVRRGDQAKCQWHVVEPAAEKYVPRAEHDALRADHEALRARVEALERLVGLSAQGPESSSRGPSAPSFAAGGRSRALTGGGYAVPRVDLGRSGPDTPAGGGSMSASVASGPARGGDAILEAPGTGTVAPLQTLTQPSRRPSLSPSQTTHAAISPQQLTRSPRRTRRSASPVQMISLQQTHRQGLASEAPEHRQWGSGFGSFPASGSTTSEMGGTTPTRTTAAAPTNTLPGDGRTAHTRTMSSSTRSSSGGGSLFSFSAASGTSHTSESSRSTSTSTSGFVHPASYSSASTPTASHFVRELPPVSHGREPSGAHDYFHSRPHHPSFDARPHRERRGSVHALAHIVSPAFPDVSCITVKEERRSPSPPAPHQFGAQFDYRSSVRGGVHPAPKNPPAQAPRGARLRDGCAPLGGQLRLHLLRRQPSLPLPRPPASVQVQRRRGVRPALRLIIPIQHSSATSRARCTRAARCSRARAPHRTCTRLGLPRPMRKSAM